MGQGSARVEIDDKLILRHVTSKTSKRVVVNLKLAPMVLEDLRRASCPVAVRRAWSSGSKVRSW